MPADAHAAHHPQGSRGVHDCPELQHTHLRSTTTGGFAFAKQLSAWLVCRSVFRAVTHSVHALSSAFLQCLYRIPIEERVRDELLLGSAAGNADRATEGYKRLRNAMVCAYDVRLVTQRSPPSMSAQLCTKITDLSRGKCSRAAATSLSDGARACCARGACRRSPRWAGTEPGVRRRAAAAGAGEFHLRQSGCRLFRLWFGLSPLVLASIVTALCHDVSAVALQLRAAPAPSGPGAAVGDEQVEALRGRRDHGPNGAVPRRVNQECEGALGSVPIAAVRRASERVVPDTFLPDFCIFWRRHRCRAGGGGGGLDDTRFWAVVSCRHVCSCPETLFPCAVGCKGCMVRCMSPNLNARNAGACAMVYAGVVLWQVIHERDVDNIEEEENEDGESRRPPPDDIRFKPIPLA